jgi:hypothetical protein
MWRYGHKYFCKIYHHYSQQLPKKRPKLVEYFFLDALVNDESPYGKLSLEYLTVLLNLCCHLFAPFAINQLKVLVFG